MIKMDMVLKELAIPEDVKNAFLILKQIHGDKVRKADPLHASK